MIIFETIRWKNFLSTGNVWTEVKLNKSTSTLIIGSNGAGKSTILDALCYVLFGKPFRKINIPNLMNSINSKDCLVELEFKIGKKNYKVVRGMKPNIFEIYIDNKLLNQDSKKKDYQNHLEQNILKFNFKSFTQIVILGSASFVPFMQLKAADRREIIEELLDIQIFSSMNTLAKDRLAVIKDESTSVKYEINLCEEKIDLQEQNIEAHRKMNDDQITKKRDEIEESMKQIDKIQGDIVLINKHIEVLIRKIGDDEAVKKTLKTLLQLESKIEANIEKINKDISFYESNDNCPTCRQSISGDFKATRIKERTDDIQKQKEGLEKLTEEFNKATARKTEIERIQQHINAHNNEIVKHNTTIGAINQYIQKLNKEISDLSTKSDALEDSNKKLRTLKKELKDLFEKQTALSTEKHYYEYASGLLKDTGIKTRIIKQYLPVMNKLVNKYLSAMDFFVNFNINENFEETIKSRHRDEFTYSNFSEGEKQKIDLALLFTWRQIAKMKNSTNTNLLILDEVFDSSLDTTSVDLLMNLLNEFSSDTNIFVISHKGDQLFDKFRSVVRFEKSGNFSRIAK